MKIGGKRKRTVHASPTNNNNLMAVLSMLKFILLSKYNF
jgi:hypothetical protein